MTIAIDYDGTYTADPALWDEFIGLLHERGHSVVCVTNRMTAGDSLRSLADRIEAVVYAGSKLKRQAVTERGIHVDIWIDDMPETIGTVLLLGRPETIGTTLLVDR